MFQKKTKFKLSKNLKLGIQGPASQGTFFKIGGVFFLALSLFFTRNAYQSLNSKPVYSVETAPTQPKVLGAFDQKANNISDTPLTASKPSNYIVQKGDTLFNVAQSQGVNWVVIATLNNLKAPYNLKPGTALKLQ
ncbi:MAG: hypothetical protein NVSMB66_4110 [Candidatus Doudnabacteria bacterium]